MTGPCLPGSIATARLSLRPFRFEDVDNILVYAGDEEWSRYLIGVPHPYQRSDAIQFLARLEPSSTPRFARTLCSAVSAPLPTRATSRRSA
jgi:RimJ/RimL family protein N-acetyltransferase